MDAGVGVASTTMISSDFTRVSSVVYIGTVVLVVAAIVVGTTVAAVVTTVVAGTVVAVGVCSEGDAVWVHPMTATSATRRTINPMSSFI